MWCSRTMPQKIVGFTLIELVVTVSMAAIVLTLGVPGIREMVLNNKMTTQVNTLVSDLNLARSEAIKRGAPVTICKRNSTASNCDSTTSWNDGWLVFADQNGDGNFDDNGDANLCEPGEDCLLRVAPPLPADIRVAFGQNRVTFDALGAAPGFSGTFKFCDARGAKKARASLIENNGRVRNSSDSPNDADQIHEDINGNNLVCP